MGTGRLVKLLSCAELAAEVNRLREFGPRETGNSERVHFVNYIAEQIKSLPSPPVLLNRDMLRFERWSVLGAGARCALTVQGSRNPTVSIASAYPYSGRTGPNGVTGPLQLFSCGHWWKNFTGKIAVIEVPYPSVPVGLFLDDMGHLPASANDPRDFRPTYQHPLLAATVFGPDLAAAKAAGAAGVVAVWKNLTAAQAADQYVPFTFPYQDIPAVWVAGEDGKQLLVSARQGARATLTLDAALWPSATTDTLWAVVEGEISNETILVVTHTDGGNSVEENGAIGVLELIRMFATGPRPKRTLVFVFATGHLRSTVKDEATTAWLNAHREWWSGKNGDRRAVASLVIEHLGAVKAQPDSGDQVELTYATNAAMRKILKNSWAGRKKGTVLIAKPGLIHLGEGKPLYHERIPAIVLISVPEYLLAATKADIVDIELIHEQIGAFARALLELDSTLTQQLGKAERLSFIRKAIRACVILLPFFARNGAIVFHLSAFVKAVIAACRRDSVPHLSFVNTRRE